MDEQEVRCGITKHGAATKPFQFTFTTCSVYATAADARFELVHKNQLSRLQLVFLESALLVGILADALAA